MYLEIKIKIQCSTKYIFIYEREINRNLKHFKSIHFYYLMNYKNNRVLELIYQCTTNCIAVLTRIIRFAKNADEKVILKVIRINSSLQFILVFNNIIVL